MDENSKGCEEHDKTSMQNDKNDDELNINRLRTNCTKITMNNRAQSWWTTKHNNDKWRMLKDRVDNDAD